MLLRSHIIIVISHAWRYHVNQPEVPREPAPEPSPELLHALGWYARQVVGLERILNAVTVKRRRNLARPVRRRKSAFRDPRICYDFLAMAWLGATRLSQIEPHLQRRRDLAQALGLSRFCDHTTAHNFLNAFHVTHIRQLDTVNARLLAGHGGALHQRAPIFDIDVAERLVRRPGRRTNHVYRWAVAFSAGEAIAQELRLNDPDVPALVAETIERARRLLRTRPRLVRLTGPCASREVFRGLHRMRLPFLAVTTWAWALEQRPEHGGRRAWVALDEGGRALDLGAALTPGTTRQWLRTILVERPAPAPGLRRKRFAIVTPLLSVPLYALLHLAASRGRIRQFYGHPRWPLGDGKLPSGNLRGNAAYLRLATIAMNMLRLFARHLGAGGSPSGLHARLRAIPWPADAPRA